MVGKRVANSSVFLCVLLLLVGGSFLTANGQALLRQRVQQRFQQHNKAGAQSVEKQQIAGLNVAVWRPNAGSSPSPLVIFSHGYHGINTQSVFIMEALQAAGYLVLAPNHKDAMGSGGGLARPDASFMHAFEWTDETFSDRGQDIAQLIDALKKQPQWNQQIDWSRVALAGHSLGGYTVLGLAGGWPQWKLSGIKAVLALSPYAEPFVQHGTLSGLGVPVMYQTGTRDLGIMPFIKRPGGAFAKTPSPAYLVELDRAGHLAWSSFNRDPAQQKLIDYYCVSFLDRYLKGDQNANPGARQPGVVDLEAK